MQALRSYGRACLRLIRIVAGIKIDVRGLENIPVGASIIAGKHHSAWETFALFPYLRDPVIIMKAELFRLPVHGWFARKFKMIPARRGKGRTAMKEMISAAKDRLSEDREIIIFPEGTRRPVGAEPSYRNGVIALYEGTSVPCCPVALNSGLFWRRRQILLYPGTITLAFLKPIPPGLSGPDFKNQLIRDLEQATDTLVSEALAGPNAPPINSDLKAQLYKRISLQNTNT